MKAAFNDLFQSRKFWIAVCDAAFSTLTVVLTLFFKPDVVDKILGVIAIWQPVVLVVIGSITAQNVAGIKAEASVKSAGLYLEQPK